MPTLFPQCLLLGSILLAGVASLPAQDPDLFFHTDLPNSFGDGPLDKAGYSFHDRQPLASFEAPDGTLWQVMGYISLHRLPVVQWRYRPPESEQWSLWARIGADASVFPATGDNWHGYLSLAIDSAGYLHIAYDGRINESGQFRFLRSNLPVHLGWSGSMVDRSDNGLPGWSSNTRSTYWRFAKHPESGLMTLALRESGRGHALFVLDAGTQLWSAFPGTRSNDGRLLTNSGIFAQYVSQDVVFRGDDLFVGFTERKTASMSNEDLSVIKYDAANGRWQRLDGTPLSIPVLPGEGTILDPADSGSMLDQRWDMMVDGHGFVHGFYRRLDDNGFLQIFHFWIDHDDHVHGPRPVTNFNYTDFWRNLSSTGVNLSKPRSFYVGDTILLAWQEENHGQRTQAMAARYPFTDWSPPKEIDNTNLFTSDPEFERWAWETRGEVWLAALPFTTKTREGRPVYVRNIPLSDLPSPPPLLTFDAWIHSFPGLSETNRDPGADPAGDGIPNLYKFAMDMHPQENGQGTRPNLHQGGMPSVERDETGAPYLLYRENTALSDIQIKVEQSEDLHAWVDTQQTPVLLQKDGDVELLRIPFPLNHQNGNPAFLRLRVRQTQSPQ